MTGERRPFDTATSIDEGASARVPAQLDANHGAPQRTWLVREAELEQPEGGKPGNHLTKQARRLTEMGGRGSDHPTRSFEMAPIISL